MKQPILFSTNLLGYAALVTLAFALICTCLALGLPYWEYYDTTLGSQQTVSNYGLWRYCINYIPDTSTLTDVCGDPVNTATGSGAADIRATRAMVILALILEIAAIVFTVLAVFRFKKKYLLHYAAAGFGIASGFFSMFGLAVYLARVRKDDYDLHASIACDILSWLVSWTSAGFIIFMVFVKKQDDK
ncbi:uncharacterized protein LOC123528761 [Mercenaria mercenaria]|uniref:uncharacterized protein LOC123528761 n=1 Tax=Mercenaria mercenaria TaxID=6596 RepID=UPI001E1DCE1F|nr:uncharacterized protein LOC123528761 [Mercenaria mercenaria]